MAAADEHHVVVGTLHPSRQAREIGQDGRGCQRDAPLGVHTASPARGTIGPMSMPFGSALIAASVSPSGFSP